MGSRAKILLATRNPGKVREIGAILGDLDINVVSLADFPDVPEVVEDGTTFFENAYKKAKEVSEATGMMVLSDDSGLQVDALGGRPGVYSARYSGKEGDDAANNAKLLKELEGVPEEKRTARFKCVMVLYHPSGKWISAEGTCEGRIALKPAGSGGFGYDPIFYMEQYGKTMAELPPEEKNRISHRAEALKALKRRLREFLASL